jgi:hypothetical protein
MLAEFCDRVAFLRNDDSAAGGTYGLSVVAPCPVQDCARSKVAAIHVSTAEISPNLQTVRRVYNSSCAPKFNGRE